MKKLLIVIDMQNDFISGSLGSGMALAVVPKVKEKISEYQLRGDFIIFTRDTHGENYLETQEGRSLPVTHCVAGTDGWEIFGGLDENCTDCVYIDKPSFGWPDWKASLEKIVGGVDGIELCGVCTDICVISNALVIKASFPEIPLSVNASCCAGVTEKSHNAALLIMKMCQIAIKEAVS